MADRAAVSGLNVEVCRLRHVGGSNVDLQGRPVGEVEGDVALVGLDPKLH